MRLATAVLAALAGLGSGLPWAWTSPSALLTFRERLSFRGEWRRQWRLERGQTLSLSVRIEQPSVLPPNARLEARWEGPPLAEFDYSGARGDLQARATAGWTKILHALDPDVYLVYRAPKAGIYRLELRTVTDQAQPQGPLRHDVGLAPLATPLPARTPEVKQAGVVVELRPLAETHRGDVLLEAEPNDTPEQAVPVPFQAGDQDQVLRVIGGGDEIEYYNNTLSGRTGDDWYRIEYRGARGKILTANLQMAEPVVSARIRVYRPGLPSAEELKPRELVNSQEFGNNQLVPYLHPTVETIPGPAPVYSYYEGRDINERAHQQDTSFRSFATRQVAPGGVYYLRVEANQPGYELELRLVDPAPYADPRQAVRQAIYYHLAEIDAWLIHRPRNIALDRRVRDGGSLFGENCMSCHTQSGVWGVADAFRHGYRPDGTVQNWRRLVNTMYESLRPTVKLADAASNTSLAPNDLGDAPAGSRVAGRNIVLHERTFPPKKLHSHQQRRTANYVLQTADPQGINAAGKGSNFGPNVVFKFAGEILERAWRDTGDRKYFFGLEDKAGKLVEIGNDRLKVSDDLGHRIEFFYRLWPQDYPRIVRSLVQEPERIRAAEELHEKFRAQVETDIRRLLAIQQPDGSWGFDLGSTPDRGRTWKRLEESGDPAATAVALIGLHAAGRRAEDPAVARAVGWLLSQQYPYGLWNVSAQTGFVTTAYTIRALSQLFPDAEPLGQAGYEARAGESLLETISRVRRLQTTGRRELAGLMIAAAESEHPQVRYYGLLGLGGALAAEGAPTLIRHLDDPVKSCREAAFWSLRQLLLDDQGWAETLRAYRAASDRARQSIQQALVTRVDLVGPHSRADLAELTRILAAGMSDPHAGARAWAFKAAWHWWVWNPPLREGINQAWVEALLRPEKEALVEMALRYSTVSLLIANGQIANQTGGKNEDQQYKELADLYKLLAARRESAGEETAARLDRRLVAVAASHFQERGTDGGPGQLGYSTPGSAAVIGRAVLAVHDRERAEGAVPWRKIALEAAANVSHQPLEQRLLDLLRGEDPDSAAAAARALTNPQSFTLPATAAALGEALNRFDRFLDAGRDRDAEALAGFLSKVRWDFASQDGAGETGFYRTLIPPRSSGEPRTSRRAALLSRILGENPMLRRKSVFSLVQGDPRFWLPSTEWMVAFQEGGPTIEEAVQGATEAENLKVLELSFGRTTEQIVPNGIASKNTILWWREGKPGERLAFAVEAPAAGRYEILAAFLYDRDYGRVQLRLNGVPVGEPMDFYKPVLGSSGPVSLGVHEFQAGQNRLTVQMLGASPEAEPNYVFAFDYIKLIPDAARGSILAKDDRGVPVIDPLTAAKDRVLRMFTAWFSAETPREAREAAINLANRTVLRRNPEVRLALAGYVERETSPRLRERIQNILNSDDKVYGEELRKLLTAQGPPRGGEARRLEPTAEFLADLLQFRDVVFAEMNRIGPEDGRACISCHGVPGRVPTLYLDPPDVAGYLAPAPLLENYRRMQQRVDLEDVEKSKFLRKPLNVQSGQEDGHQGGTRYQSDSLGYRLIREWVLKQARLQKQ